MPRTNPTAKNLSADAHLLKTASGHVAVLAALDYGREDRHDRSTMTMFATLISSYWTDLSLGERRTIAKALAVRPDLPRSLIDQFLADHFTVANLIIDASPLLDEPDFYRIADSRVMPMIRIVARRTIPTDLVAVLAEMRDTSTALALAFNSGIHLAPDTLDCMLEVATRNQHVARVLAMREDLPLKAKMMLYPELDHHERRRVIDLAERESLINLANPGQRAPIPTLSDDQRMTLVELSKRLGKDEFFNRLNGNLKLDRRYMDAILEQDTGEMQAIIFAGLGFSAAQATTLFIILGAQDSRSYRDIKDLIDLFERVRWRVASQFLNAWRDLRQQGSPGQVRAESLGDRDDNRRAGTQAGDRSRKVADGNIIQNSGAIASLNRQ